MNFEDLVKIYEKKKIVYGKETFKYISEILAEVKKKHKRGFQGEDHEQSWRAFKGKNLEKLIAYIITQEVHDLGLEIINGNSLERTKSENLTEVLAQVKRNLLIDYGEFGYHLPDVDLVIFDPTNANVKVVLSVKVTLRERIAQTAYWKLKLTSDKLTRHIKVFFVTLDEDATLQTKKPVKKARAIVENDLDGSYVLTEEQIEPSVRVKLFDKFISDLKKIK